MSVPPHLSFFEEQIKLSKPIANYSCQKMGTLCFDPQIGLFDPKDEQAIKYIDSENIINLENIPQIPIAGSIDRNMIHCEKDHYFDIFCGEAKKENKKLSGLHIWIDTSASIRGKDPLDRQYNCLRKSFVSYLQSSCSKSPEFFIFDTSIKQLGGIDTTCTTRGLNDPQKIIEWIKNTDAKELIIVTDIDEYTQELRDFVALNSKIGKFIGHETNSPLYPEDILKRIPKLAKSCR